MNLVTTSRDDKWEGSDTRTERVRQTCGVPTLVVCAGAKAHHFFWLVRPGMLVTEGTGQLGNTFSSIEING